jgi:hypothetical protein
MWYVTEAETQEDRPAEGEATKAEKVRMQPLPKSLEDAEPYTPARAIEKLTTAAKNPSTEYWLP